MFDIGFWELTVVAVVALLVVGPERLPKLARTLGIWVGKARKMVASVKADVERELRAEELKQILEKQARANPLEEIVEETKGSFRDVEESTAKAVRDAEDQFDSPASERAAKTSNDGK